MSDKMIQEKIDIIIPMYNAEKTIAATLQSVINQSYHNWRIIVIDDGSTDNSSSIVKKYKDERIEYFFKENGGIVSARIAGIEKLKNKYAMMLDSDDILHPQSLEIFQMIIKKTNADIVISQAFQNMSKHGHFKIKDKYEIEEVICEMIDLEKAKRGLLGEQNYTPTVWDKLFLSEIMQSALEDIKTIPKELKTGEDMCMNLCFYKKAHSIAMGHVKLYNYRYSNTFHNKTRQKMDEVVMLYQWRSQFIEKEKMNREYHILNLTQAFYLLLFYGFDDMKEKRDFMVEETKKYIDVDENNYVIPENRKDTSDSWIIKLKRWVLKNL